VPNAVVIRNGFHLGCVVHNSHSLFAAAVETDISSLPSRQGRRVTIDSDNGGITAWRTNWLLSFCPCPLAACALLCQTPASLPAALIQDGKTVYAGNCSDATAPNLRNRSCPEAHGNSDVRGVRPSSCATLSPPAFRRRNARVCIAAATPARRCRKPLSIRSTLRHRRRLSRGCGVGGPIFLGRGYCGSCTWFTAGDLHGAGSIGCRQQETADEITLRWCIQPAHHSGLRTG